MSIYEERVRRIRKIMTEKGVNAMVIAGIENYYYITGDVRRQARMVFPAEGEPTLIVFFTEEEFVRKNTWIKDVRPWRNVSELMGHFFSAMKEKDLTDKTVGFDVHSAPGFEVYRFRKLNPKINLVETDEVLMELRMYKSREEIERMRDTAKIAEKGMKAAIETVAPGISENEVAAETEYAMRKAGAERWGTIPFVNSGYRSLYLHGFVSRKIIEKGDPVLIDVHPICNMYAADMARTVVCGQPSLEQKKAASTYVQAQKQTREALRPGWKVGDVTQFMKGAMEKLPYGEFNVPAYIHGVGLEFEEWPHPSHYPQHNSIILKSSMTMSVGHATLPVPGIGGFRVEDTVLITEEGCESLTTYEHELI
jgi:Xaa-Pro dipeptidase